MVDLTAAEKKTLEGFFGAGNTTSNWFATHRDLDDLFTQYKLDQFDIEIEPGGSKRDRIRAVWSACPNAVVSKFMLELLQIGYSEEVDPSPDWLAKYEECKGILESLRFRNGDAPEIELAKSFFQNQKELVLKDWDEADLGIWICQYLFMDRQLADKLLEKYRQGLTVMLILQDEEMNHRLQKTHWDKMPCSVWWFPKTNGGGINHHKFCIVDGQILWHGSFNFTWRAANKNQEEFTRDPNPQKVKQFAAEFTRLRKVIDEEERVRRAITPLF